MILDLAYEALCAAACIAFLAALLLWTAILSGAL